MPRRRRFLTLLVALASIGGIYAGTASGTTGHTIKIDDITVNEGGSGSFTVTISPAPETGETIAVQATSADVSAAGVASSCPGTNLGNADYIDVPTTTLTFFAGQTTKSVAVTTCQDVAFEGNETFFVNLTNASTSCVSPCTTSTVSILDPSGQATIVDDELNPTLSVVDITEPEGAAAGTALPAATPCGSTVGTPFVFVVTLTPVSTQTVTVHYSTADGTAKQPSDYASQTGTLTFLAGQDAHVVCVPVVGDLVVEPDETFFLNLDSPTNATIANQQGIATIMTDDFSTSPSPLSGTVQIDDVSLNEGHTGTTPFTFTVTLSEPQAEPLAVNFSTTPGTASAGSDYTAASGTLIFAANQTAKTIRISVSGDKVAENDETFSVNLTPGCIVRIVVNVCTAPGTITKGEGKGTIKNDDGSPSPSPSPTGSGSPSPSGSPGPRNVSISDASASEGDVVTFTVSLTSACAGGSFLVLPFDTRDANGQPAGTATEGTDYPRTLGSIAFASGQTSKTIAVPTMEDNATEPNETFSLFLGTPSGGCSGTVTDGNGVGTIVDDESNPNGSGPALSISDGSTKEADKKNKTCTLTVTLSPAGGQLVTVAYATEDGSAKAGKDYEAQQGSLTFFPGETTKDLKLTVLPDNKHEKREAFKVKLSNPSGATLASKSSGTCSIVDDD